MNSVWSNVLPLAMAMAWQGCGGPTDRPEVLDRLRGIGVAPSPVVSIPSEPDSPKTVELTIYAALLPGESATLTPYKDTVASGAILLEESAIEILETLEPEDHNGFRLFKAKAQATVPTSAVMSRGGTEPAAGQVRYGFKLESAGDVEYIVGNFLVFPSGSDELSWSAPDVTLVEPTGGADLGAKSEVELKATVANSIDEEVKFGWFTTGGKVVNRRAYATSWETPEAGNHSVIATVRGKKSRGFAIKVIDVNIK